MRKKSIIQKILFVFISLIAFSLPSFSQNVVNGNVTGSGGDALEGVSVTIKGESGGATTDARGAFTIRVPNLNATLVFSYIGFDAQEVPLNGRTTVSVLLVSNARMMDQVIVVGYGTQKKSRITGAVSTLSREDLTNRPVTQISQALQGKMAGVTVTQNFGAPGGDGGQIRIRGIGTLGNAEPLVLIDGVPGSLNDVNPNDIENLSILKDAASASIYGSRGANGVILISTKRGRKNQPLTVTYNGQYSIQQATDLPNLVDGATFMMLRNEESRNGGAVAPFTPDFINTYTQNVGTEPHFNTNWFDHVLTNNSPQHLHTLSFRGGGDKMASHLSLTYLGQEGLTANTNFERLGVRFNNNLQATEKLSFILDARLNREERKLPNGTGNGLEQLFRMMYEIPNIYPAVWKDGTLGEGWNGDNPYAYIHVGGTAKNISNRIQLNLRGQYNIFDWLNLEVGYSPIFTSNTFEGTVKTYNYRRIDNSTGFKPTPNSLNNSFNRTQQDLYTGILRFNKTFSRHSVSALAGLESQIIKSENFGASRQNFTLQNYMVLNAGDPNADDNNGSKTEWELFSNFGQIVYAFDNKYLFEAKLRYDGSSRFSTDNRWGTFPAFSIGWVLSEESFLRKSNKINYLKITGSWGQLGNQEVGGSNYPYLSLVSLNQPYYFNNTPVVGAAQTVMANDIITWETAETLNGRVEWGLFRNRLTGSLDVYRKVTKDILYAVNVSATIGLSAAPQNVAKVKNTGWDLVTSWDDKAGKVSYGIDVVLSDVRNKVLDLKDRSTLNRNAIIEGEEFNVFYGYEVIGLYRTPQDLTTYPRLNANVKVGDLIYKDGNKDGVIDANDKKVIGSNIPRYTYSTTLHAGYAGFNLSIFLQGVGKKNLYFTSFNPSYGGNYSTYQLKNRFAPDDPTTHQTAILPRLLAGTSVNTEDNSFYLYNAAYLRCKNVQLSYDFPKNIINRLKVNSVRVWVSGTNLFTLDKLPINTIDPESPSTVNGANFYPNIKTYTLGIDVNF